MTSIRKRLTAWRAAALLAAIVLLGAYFSTLSLFSWDANTGQHPDERFMALVAAQIKAPASLGEYLDSQHNPLNPRNVGFPFYVYGLLPQALTHYTGVLLTPNVALPPTVAPPSPGAYGSAAPIANPDLGQPKLAPLQALLNPAGADMTSYLFALKIGRAWSALFTLLSVVVVFLIGRRLYGERAGLLAALLLAVSVLPIQIAHFFTVDSATAFFTLLTMYWAVRLAQQGGWGCALLLGLSIGAATATRLTLGALGLLALLAVAQRLWAGPAGTPRRALLGAAGLLALAGIVALVSFRLLQPDAFVGTSFFDIRLEPRFVGNIRAINAVVAGQLDSPPSQQWVGRTRYLFPLYNMIGWGMGWPLGLAAWAAWAAAGWQLFRWRRLAHLLPWAWVTFFFGWQGGIFGMTMRYYLPLYGLLALFAAWGLLAITDRRAQIGGWVRRRLPGFALAALAAWLPSVVVVAATLGWAYAFTRIYTRPHSRVAAARWVHANIAPGARLTWEEWDDTLPLQVDGHALDEYGLIRMQPYTNEDANKYFGTADAAGAPVFGVFDQLDQADYIVLSSNRVYGSATRLPMRYPALTRYYRALFSGELGFALAAEIHSYPTLFGIGIPDQGAEEAFTVYDHPRVLIFQKTPSYSRARAEQLIAGDISWDEVYTLPSARADRLPTALRLTDVEWPAFRSGGTWARLFDPAGLANQLPWLVWLLTLEAIGLAMFALLFRLLPGLPDRGFALAKMLALLLVAYAAWLLGSARLLAFGPASVWLCAGLLIAIGGVVGWRARRELRAFVRLRFAALLVAEQLFVLLWLSFVLIRALNPDLWHPARGGEKPMDLAFLTAVVKSPYFPPYDPWFAGGYINARYFGLVIVGTLVHLTGIEPATAYNLAVPTLFALTALGAWGVGYNLVAPHDAGRLRGRRLRRELRAGLAGALAVVFVALAGNLGNALAFLSGYPSENAGRPEWAYWDAVQIARPGLPGVVGEFPFFTFLYADLGPHMLALPLALAALGLMVALTRTKAPGQKKAILWFLPFAACLGCLGLVLGALRATDGWDYPTYLALASAALSLVALRMRRRGLAWRAAVAGWLGGSLGLLALSTLLFLPFTRHFADITGARLRPDTGATAGELLRTNGLWLFVLLSAGVAMLLGNRNARISIGHKGIPYSKARIVRAFAGQRALGVFVVPASLLVMAAVAAVFGASALALLLGLAGLAAFAAGRLGRTSPGIQLSPAALLPMLWVLGGLLVNLAGALLIFVGDAARLNATLYLGLQSWVLLACASAPALVWLWRALARRGRLGWAWKTIALLLIAAALAYPLSATPARIADRFDPRVGPTLDGMAFMQTGRWAENDRQFPLAEDAAAIEWMRRNIAGTPIVLEAVTAPYRWAGRVSTYTGLPTLLGWAWHEQRQRLVALAGGVIDRRERLIARLYSGGEAAGETLRLLQLYGVEYVYVGQLERALYPPAGLEQLDRLAQSGQIKPVYRQDATVIYQVPARDRAPAVLASAEPD